MEVVGGNIVVRMGGRALRLGGSCKVSIRPTEKSVVEGLGGPVGFKAQRKCSFVEIEVVDGSEEDIQALQDADNVDVQVELANGKAATLTEAVQVNAVEFDAGEGNATLRFETDYDKGKWV